MNKGRSGLSQAPVQLECGQELCSRGNWDLGSSRRFSVCLPSLSNSDIYPASQTAEKETKFLVSPLSQQEMLLNLDCNVAQFRDYK